MLSTIKESLFNGLKKSLKGDLFCPNITGDLRSAYGGLGVVSDAGNAFYNTDTGPYAQNQNSSYTRSVGMLASRSNSIYTDSGNVLPLSISKQSYIIYK